MAENLALGAILDDTSMLQRLQFDHSHEALMNANNPGIANLDVNFTSLLDPDLMMDSEAGRMGASFATHAAFDNAMDLDDPRPEGHAPSDDAEDIGHSLQTTLVGHMKYMGMLWSENSSRATIPHYYAPLQSGSLTLLPCRTQHVGKNASCFHRALHSLVVMLSCKGY